MVISSAWRRFMALPSRWHAHRAELGRQAVLGRRESASPDRRLRRRTVTATQPALTGLCPRLRKVAGLLPPALRPPTFPLVGDSQTPGNQDGPPSKFCSILAAPRGGAMDVAVTGIPPRLALFPPSATADARRLVWTKG